MSRYKNSMTHAQVQAERELFIARAGHLIFVVGALSAADAFRAFKEVFPSYKISQQKFEKQAKELAPRANQLVAQ